MIRQTILLLLLAVMLIPANAQSWKQYPYVPEGSIFTFPDDEGRHPDEPVEWWYMAGHVVGSETGTNYSFMLTYFSYPYGGFEGFRILNLSNDDTGEFYTETLPLVYTTLGLDTLNIEAVLLSSAEEFWTTRKDSTDALIPFEYDISATSANGSINVGCESLKPPIFIGDSGMFLQGTQSYTYYYSQTMNEISGTISLNDNEEVVEGTAWIDRQFGGFNEGTGERYEWFSVQLSNGTDLNIWNIFTEDNQLPDSATFKHMTISLNSTNHFTTTDFNLERLTYHFMPDSVMCYSQKWRLTSPENNLDLLITTLHNHTEVTLPFRFYEGSTYISGFANGEQVTGKGFAELLKNYEIPQIFMNDSPGGPWDGTMPISWHLINPDDGRPLLYDLEYSTDQFEPFQLVASGLFDTLFHWINPPITYGDSCWFRVKGYSIDSTLTNYSGNSDAFVYAPDTTVGVQPGLYRETSMPFKIYPNPARRVLNIESLPESNTFQTEVYNLQGQKVLGSLNSTGRSSIALQGLPAGSYVLKIHVDSKEYHQLFVIGDW